MDNEVECVKGECSHSRSTRRVVKCWECESVTVCSLLFGRAASRVTRGPRTVPVLAIGRQYPVRGHMSVTRRTKRGTIMNQKKGLWCRTKSRMRLDW